MKKILVTGGAGFIGSNLVRQLVSSGYYVVVYDNQSNAVSSYSELKPNKEVVGDVKDLESLKLAMKDIDAVIHLAASGSVVESIESPVNNFYENVLGTFNVLNAAQLMGIKKVVFASTGGAIMGDTPPPVDETSLPKPISPYGASKLCGEAYCNAFSASYDMSITMLRFANVYGPYSHRKKGAATQFMKNVLQGKPITIYGDGSASRDFLYVDDLCHGIMLALEHVGKADVFHLASGKETTVSGLAKAICECAGKTDQEIIYESSRKGEVLKNFAAFSKAEAVLGFKPQVNFEEGLNITWEWFNKL